ncbi:MAG: AMP-binding protein, partial [Ilumatobacteraceae bacterium]
MYPGAFAATHPDKPAVIAATSGFTQTFGELDAAANRFSRLLRSAGVNPGDHVAVCMENHDRYFEVIWGCHYAGAVYTACSSRLTSHELAYILNDCQAAVFVTSKYKADQAAEIVADTPGVQLRLMLDGTIGGYDSYERAVAEQSSDPLDEQRIAGTDMLYSSGTTGLPKGVVRPFESELLESTPGGVATTLEILFGLTFNSIYLSPAPNYHAAPLRFSLGAMATGCTVVVMEH